MTSKTRDYKTIGEDIDYKVWAEHENFEFVTPNGFVTWCVPFCHRADKCSVGRKFALKEIFKTGWYHNHYEEYDYSKYEYIDFD